MKMLFRFSKTIHKYLGLLLALFLLWMGLSGILLNHPNALKRISIPLWAMPDAYAFTRWNRGSLRDALIPVDAPETVVVAGKQGVWVSRNRGESFQSVNRGFPANRGAFCLFHDQGLQRLVVGTETGVYQLKLGEDGWNQPLPQLFWEPMAGLENQRVVSLFTMAGQFIATTGSGLFQWSGEQFSALTLPGPAGEGASISLAMLLLHIHDGSILGFPGRILVDVAGAVLVFLALSGIYIWYMSGRLGKFRGKRSYVRLFRFCYAKHFRWGIWFSLILIPVTITGFLIRPPFLPLVYHLFGGQVSPGAVSNDNPWKENIHQATYQSLASGKGRLVLSTKKGVYLLAVDQGKIVDAPAVRQALPVRISGMGANIFKTLDRNQLMVGSFSGAAVLDDHFNVVWSRPRTRAMGALISQGKPVGIAEFRQGYLPLEHASPVMTMPRQLNESGRVRLWFALFELHNGRIFQGLLGGFTWMIIPVGGLLSLLILGTGCFDWAYRKGWFKR